MKIRGASAAPSGGGGVRDDVISVSETVGDKVNDRVELTSAIRERALGLSSPDREAVLNAAPRLAEYLVLLRRANAVLNLVSRRETGIRPLIDKHLFDALHGLTLLPPPTAGPLRLLDIGSGGGFPAIPLQIVRGDIEAVLVETVGKKARFLRETCTRLRLTATVLNARFPDSFPMKNPLRFHVLTTRAVARAGRLARHGRPLLERSAKVLLWTTEPLFEEATAESGLPKATFHKTHGAEEAPTVRARGIGVLESFT